MDFSEPKLHRHQSHLFLFLFKEDLHDRQILYRMFCYANLNNHDFYFYADLNQLQTLVRKTLIHFCNRQDFKNMFLMFIKIFRITKYTYMHICVDHFKFYLFKLIFIIIGEIISFMCIF